MSSAPYLGGFFWRVGNYNSVNLQLIKIMVALNRANIPATITTVESLAAWCTAVLTNLHFQQEVTEAPNIIQKVAVSQTFPITLNDAYSWRYVGRVSLPVLDSYVAGGKIWEKVTPLSNSSIPADFTS
jgi:hypothetical protein